MNRDFFKISSIVLRSKDSKPVIFCLHVSKPHNRIGKRKYAALNLLDIHVTCYKIGY